MANGLLDALIYNPSTSAGKRRYERERAEDYSQVYQDAERNLAMAGQKPEHHPMRMAEQLLRSGNPTAVKTGEAMMTQYHTGKTGDIKEYEYGLTLSEEEAQDWMNRNLRSGQDVFGTPLKVRRKDGSIGYFVPRKSQNGPYLQDMGQDAYIEDKVVQLGGGRQGLYRDGNGRLVVGPQGDATAQANGYQSLNLPPEIEAQINEYLRAQAYQQQGQQPPPQGPAARYQQQPPPQAQPQSPTVRPVTPDDEFNRRTRETASNEAFGKRTGTARGDAVAARGQDWSNLQYINSKNRVVMPEIERAKQLLGVDRMGAHILNSGLPGLSEEYRKEIGNIAASGDAMAFQNFAEMLPSVMNIQWPTVEKWIGSDAQKLREMLNVIETNIAFDRLQEMREASPTGGALGQVSDMENQMLKQSLASLSQYNSPRDLLFGLNKVQHHYQRVQKLAQLEFLMKHTYQMQEGQTDINTYMQTLGEAAARVFGPDDPQLQEIMDQIQMFSR